MDMPPVYHGDAQSPVDALRRARGKLQCMSLAWTQRTFEHPDGWDGDGWSRAQRRAFAALMEAHSVKHRGMPARVTAWGDGRGVLCWYAALCGPEEVAIRGRCRVIFGQRERAEATVIADAHEHGRDPSQRHRSYRAQLALALDATYYLPPSLRHLRKRRCRGARGWRAASSPPTLGA